MMNDALDGGLRKVKPGRKYEATRAEIASPRPTDRRAHARVRYILCFLARVLACERAYIRVSVSVLVYSSKVPFLWKAQIWTMLPSDRPLKCCLSLSMNSDTFCPRARSVQGHMVYKSCPCQVSKSRHVTHI